MKSTKKNRASRASFRPPAARKSRKFPVPRGGNGSPPTVPEQRLLEALNFTCGLVVPTGKKVQGVPTHFKIDVGNAMMKIAIEIDGWTHTMLGRQIEDARKADWLRDHGWHVIRFTNDEIIGRLEASVLTVRREIGNVI